MLISMFIITAAIHNGESCHVSLLIVCTHQEESLMEPPQTQSKAPHYAANFKNIVLLVNQCFFIMDAITVIFFFYILPDIVITHYGFVHTTSSQLTSEAS